MVSDELLTEFVADNPEAMQREVDMVTECARLIELVQGLKDLVIAGKIECFAEGPVNWRQPSAFHAIQVRSEEVIEQVHLIDTVRARPFTDDSTH